MSEPLPRLSSADLDILLTALDPLLDGFADGASCLDDARAYLERLRGQEQVGEPLQQWLQAWQAAGGNRATLRLMVSTLLAEREHLAERSRSAVARSGSRTTSGGSATDPGLT